MTKVKNITNTSTDTPPKNTSWLEYAGGNKYDKCVTLNCNNKQSDGAHVKKEGNVDNKIYIIPVCHKCNENTETYDVLSNSLIAR